jgi:hypothetical protein
MEAKIAPGFDSIFTGVRERRRKARVTLSCFILVRPFDPEPEYFESIILTDESCRDGLSFRTDNGVYRQRMRLLVTFPYSLYTNTINREYVAEVVRTEALQDDRYSIAVRFLTTARLSIPTISRLQSSNIWNVLWQRARATK